MFGKQTTATSQQRSQAQYLLPPSQKCVCFLYGDKKKWEGLDSMAGRDGWSRCALFKKGILMMLIRFSVQRIGLLLNRTQSVTILHYSSGYTYGGSEGYSYQQQQQLLLSNSLSVKNNLCCLSLKGQQIYQGDVSFRSQDSFAIRNTIQDDNFPGLNSNALTEVTGDDDGYSCLSVLKQRRKKMKKHKYKKWRKRMRFVRKAHGR